MYLPIAAEFTGQKSLSRAESVVGRWSDSTTSTLDEAPARPQTHHGTSSTIRTRAMEDTPELPIRTTSRSFNSHTPLPPLVQAPTSIISPDPLPDSQTRQKSLKKRNLSSSSTIFMNSPLAPVTIIVTTPEDDIPSPPPSPSQPTPSNTFNEIRANKFKTEPNNDSTTTLPEMRYPHNFSTDSLFVPDLSRLQPPTENQIDTRRLRKAKESREFRRFLIQFMNTKGDQFPKKLRFRLMEAYSIAEADLLPSMVEKFRLVDMRDGDRDEGVALESLGNGDEDDSQHMSILQSAFMSMIPQPPKRDLSYDHRPNYRNRQGSLGSRRSTMTIKEEEALGFYNNSRTTTELPISVQMARKPHSPLTRAFASEPNLHRLNMASLNQKVPPVPALPKPQYVEKVMMRNTTFPAAAPAPTLQKLKVMDPQVKAKRQSIFGAVREAIGGTKSGKSDLKRRTMIEAVK